MLLSTQQLTPTPQNPMPRALQVKRGIQWLAAPRQEHLRLAGVLLLRELAEAAPAIFNVHVRSFIEVRGCGGTRDERPVADGG